MLRISAWLSYWTARLGCLLRGGHDDITHFAPNRIYMQCQSCRRQTPGWIVRGDTWEP